ncbi:hypothetical protein CMI47_19400 [Candidatus Pacearchaeota archaeon]|nr:hypothetical protein [Candidatus Pacearchaeota archaeon]|tara:strand:+ start:2583 stop:2816 length:234 start_codon:yes stop_codon:yes gene_type:complete
MTSGDLIRVEYPPEWNLESYYGIVLESWKEYSARWTGDPLNLVPHNNSDMMVLTPHKGVRVVERALIQRRWDKNEDS